MIGKENKTKCKSDDILMKKYTDAFLKYLMGLNMKHMKWFTQCFYISRFIHPIFFRRQMCTYFLLDEMQRL